MRRAVRRLSAALLMVVVAQVSARADGISGTYVGHGSNSAFRVQIVQTSDGRLTGRYSQVLLSNGKLTETNASITGASDGHTIALTMTPTEVLAGTLTLSGTVEGSLLHATGGGYGNTLTLNLTKSSEDQYRALVAELAHQGDLANNKRAIQEALPRVDALTNQMATFVEGLPARLARFAPIEGQYRTITERMRMGLARQRSIYGDGQASVARGQLDVAINQAGVQANQLHLSVQSSYDEFASKSAASGKLIADMIRLCQSATTNIGDEALVARWQATCGKIVTAEPDFHKHVGLLRHRFTQIERVWQEERVKQEGLIRSADSTH
ncbi:MAG TPA: hypothetical protein VIJ52_07015 [Pseudolabrys sp.]